MLLRCESLEPPMSRWVQPLPSQDFCGTAALPPETGHRSARLARQKMPRAAVSNCSNVSVRKSNYSITSSARTSSEVGTSRPSALVAFRFITGSNLIGCSIGRSLRFGPLQDLVHVPNGAPKQVFLARAIGHQPPVIGVLPEPGYRRQTVFPRRILRSAFGN